MRNLGLGGAMSRQEREEWEAREKERTLAAQARIEREIEELGARAEEFRQKLRDCPPTPEEVEKYIDLKLQQADRLLERSDPYPTRKDLRKLLATGSGIVAEEFFTWVRQEITCRQCKWSLAPTGPELLCCNPSSTRFKEEIQDPDKQTCELSESKF